MVDRPCVRIIAVAQQQPALDENGCLGNYLLRSLMEARRYACVGNPLPVMLSFKSCGMAVRMGAVPRKACAIKIAYSRSLGREAMTFDRRRFLIATGSAVAMPAVLRATRADAQ